MLASVAFAGISTSGAVTLGGGCESVNLTASAKLLLRSSLILMVMLSPPRKIGALVSMVYL
jgi:Na+/H+-dicarboxylate symporter